MTDENGEQAVRDAQLAEVSKKLETLERDRRDLWESLSATNKRLDELGKGDAGKLRGEVEDIQIWKARIHALLTDATPRGKTKLSSFGRGFKAKYGLRQ